MQYLFVDKNMKYDGSQLRSLYSYLNHQILGDSIIAWLGPCDVSLKHMVDGEDLLAKSAIKANKMLHFIIEVFDTKLMTAVCLQRLLAEICITHVKNKSEQINITQKLVRCGDDIYFNQQKFNISIATVSPNSALVHFALNIDGQGAPVETLSLADLKLDPKESALDILKTFVSEFVDIKRATQKVKWVN